jgi:fibronectin-binding autotransporter adhesin
MGADAFEILVEGGLFGGQVLTLSGVGVINNSGIEQTLEPLTLTGSREGGGVLKFTQNATAGTSMHLIATGGLGGSAATIFFLGSSSASNAIVFNSGAQARASGGGITIFGDQSTAANAVVTNEGAINRLHGGGRTQFQQNATADHAVFVNATADALDATSGVTEFFDQATAAEGTFTSNGSSRPGFIGGVTRFFESATAGNATLIARGGSEPGSIEFADNSHGGTARVELFNNGNLDISSHNSFAVTIGSLEGNGPVFLGANSLIVGTNDADTAFSGEIQDGGLSGGSGGALTKTGKGTLTLTNASSYTGGTIIDKGALVITNRSDSATGTGLVQVRAGTLGGRGTISAAVTVGSEANAAFLSPRSGKRPGKFTILSALMFEALATYEVDLDSTTTVADKVVAVGVIINSGAQSSFTDLGAGTLAQGTVFTVIDNTAATPIAGTFANLPDGSTLLSGVTPIKPAVPAAMATI